MCRQRETSQEVVAIQLDGLFPAVELHDGDAYLRHYAAAGEKKGDPSSAVERAWQSYCQILFCMNEFIHVE